MTHLTPLTAQIDIMGIWRLSFFIGMALGVISLVKQYWDIFGVPASILWGYALLYSLYLFEFPGLPFGEFNTAFQVTAGQNFAEVLLIPLVMIHAPQTWAKKFETFFNGLILLDILLIWTHKIPGVMVATSFDTALLALFVPLSSLAVGALSIVTILTHHGGTAQLILAAEAAVYAMRYPRFRKHLLWIIPGLLGALYIHHHGAWFDGLERVQKYQNYMRFWLQSSWFMIFGVGPGSFMWCSMLIDRFIPPLFLQMHSDWLQILFELGVIGLVLSLSVIYEAFTLVKSTRFEVALAGLCVFGLTYHPLRFFPSLILSAYIFWRILVIDRDNSYEL